MFHKSFVIVYPQLLFSNSRLGSLTEDLDKDMNLLADMSLQSNPDLIDPLLPLYLIVSQVELRLKRSGELLDQTTHTAEPLSVKKSISSDFSWKVLRRCLGSC